MTRFPEPARVALRAEDDERHLLTGLRQPQQRREAISRAGDEPGLAADDVDVAAADDLIRAVRRDDALADVLVVNEVLRMIAPMRSSAEAYAIKRARSYADDRFSASRPEGSAYTVLSSPSSLAFSFIRWMNPS